MLVRIPSASLHGIEAYQVEVEVDISPGLPAFIIVGLPDAAVRESKERVRAALRNCGFDFPAKKIIIKLSSSQPEERRLFFRPARGSRAAGFSGGSQPGESEPVSFCG